MPFQCLKTCSKLLHQDVVILSIAYLFVYIVHLPVVCNGLSVYEIVNSTNSTNTIDLVNMKSRSCCNIVFNTEHFKTLLCNKDINCTLSIHSKDNLTLIEVTDTIVNGTDYLYFENPDSIINKYVSFFGDITSYKLVTRNLDLIFHVRAAATIKLSDVVANSQNMAQFNPLSSPDTFSVPEKVRVFNRLIKCSYQQINEWNISNCSNTCKAFCECRLSTRGLHQRCTSLENDGNLVQNVEDIFVILPSSFNALDLSSNNLSVIDNGVLGSSFQGYDSIQWLYLNKNNLKTLHRGIFIGLTNLGHVDISLNGLRKLSPGTFRDLNKLDELFLDYNNLTVLETGTFNGLFKLTTLHICCNEIEILQKDVFLDLPSLLWLSLSNNKLTDIDSLYGMTLLQSLALQQNQLKRVSENIFELLPNLTTLNLSFNRLNVLPGLHNLSRLELVDIRKNPLKKVHEESFEGLNSFTDVLVDEQGTCCFVTHSNCNASNPKPPYLTCKRMLPHVTLRAFMWILGWMALIGNGFVLCWRCIGKLEEDKVQSLLITNLALSDMLMGIYMLILIFADTSFGRYFPSYAELWRSGVTCKLAGVLSLTSCEASVFFVTLISVDRFIRVVYPHTIHRLRYQTTRRASLILWFIALVLAVTPVAYVGRNNNVYDISEVCIGLPLVRKSIYKIEETKYQPVEWFVDHQRLNISTQSGSTSGMYFSNAIFLGLNLVCFCVVVFCYLAILKAVRDTSKRVNVSRNRDKEIKMAAKMFMIVGTDCLCWVPIIITGLLVQCEVISIPPVMFAWAVTFVLPINSSVNPYLYTIPTMISKYYGCRNPICHVSSSSEIVRIPGIPVDTTQDTKMVSSRVCSNSKSPGEMEMHEMEER